MANLKEVRNRISSVSSTQQITSAMKMVSAAKLKKAQDAIVQMRPYANKLKDILGNVSSTLSAESDNSPYTLSRPTNKVLLIVITSNRGLCGAFNANIIKLTNQLIKTNYAEVAKQGNLHIITIGRKATEFFKKQNYKHLASYDSIFDKLNFANATPIAEEVMKGFVEGTYDKVEMIYNQFKNAAVQIPVVEQFLPVQASEVAAKSITNTEYTFEPSKATIVTELIPRSLRIQLYKTLLDSFASEHGARMTAMHKATDNAKELLKELKLSYNKARQAAITNEILEIVAGAEALNG